MTRGGFGNRRLVGRRSAGVICAIGTNRPILGRPGGRNICQWMGNSATVVLRSLDVVSAIGRMIPGIPILCDHCHRGKRIFVLDICLERSIDFCASSPQQRKLKNKNWQLGYAKICTRRRGCKGT